MLAENKRARFDYDILEDYEAGIELLGLEVKSLRKHGAALDAAHVTIRGGEAYITQMSIPPYQLGNTPVGYEPERTRRILLTKSQIRDLAAVESGKGLTIVPLKVYNKGKKVKISIAIVRGKKKFDKRATTMKRESDRHIERTMKYE